MWKAVLGTSRPQFLILAPLCVSVAVAYAGFLGLPLNIKDVILCYLAAFLSHASVNMLNEYHDNLSGLDNLTQRTPFNGGSGTLQRFPEGAEIVRVMALALLLITVAIGLYFVWLRGWELLLIGLLATVSVLLYTPQINKLPIVCLIAPGFGFGIAFVVGSFVAITGQKDIGILLLALPIFILTNNLLLLNQFPDKAADQQSGRQHLIIQYGDQMGSAVYLANLLLLTISTFVIIHLFDFSVAGLSFAGFTLILPLLAGFVSLYGLNRYIETQNLANFTPFLACNVFAALSYPSILSGLLFF